MIFWQHICALWTDFLSTDQYVNAIIKEAHPHIDIGGEIREAPSI
jgi:hypothetical protein